MNEFTFENCTLTSDHSSWLSYRQLWLFVLCYFSIMNDQTSQRNIARQIILHAEWQQRRWYELYSLTSKNEYRRLQCTYHDQKAANVSAIEKCVRDILFLKNYVINAEQMRRIVQLNCQLLSDVSYVEKETTTSELTSNHDNCEQNIFDRCDRSKKHSFQADKKSLFLDHIYSSSYCTLFKWYLTFFVVKQDFFCIFFYLKEDDLNQQLLTRVYQENYVQHQNENVAMFNSKVQSVKNCLSISLNVTLASEDVVIEQDDLDDELDSDHAIDSISSSRESILSQSVSVSSVLSVFSILSVSSVSSVFSLFISSVFSLVVSSVSSIFSKLSIESSQTSLVSYVSSLIVDQLESSLHMTQQQHEEKNLFFAQTSWFLFRQQSERMLMMLSSTENNRFRKRHADACNVISVMNALKLLSELSFIVQNNDKRMKMITSIIIWKKTRLQRLQIMIAVLQNNVTALIHCFETYKDSDEKLWSCEIYELKKNINISQENSDNEIWLLSARI